jgi:hypothetical protein
MQMYCTFALFVNQHFPGLPTSGTHCITMLQLFVGKHETFGLLHVVLLAVKAHTTKYQYSLLSAGRVVVGNHNCTTHDRTVTCFPSIGKLVHLIRRRNSKRKFNKAVTMGIESQPTQTQCEMSNVRAATTNKVTFQDWQVHITVYSSLCYDYLLIKCNNLFRTFKYVAYEL